MDEEYAIKTLKRVHDSAVRADENGAKAVVEQFNETVELLQSEYPDNDVIHGIDEIIANIGTPVVATDDEWMKQPIALEKVKLKTEQMADALDLGEGFDRPTAEGEMQKIVIEQHSSQSNQQEVSQEVSVESVMTLIDHDPQVQRDKEEVKDLVRRFEEELEGDADPGTLRQFIADAKEYSTGVAAKMAMLALQHGAVGVLGL